MVYANWQKARYSWTGADGSVWDWTTGREGVLLRPGAEGLTLPKLERFMDESPALNGGRHLGTRRKPRELFFPFWVRTENGSADFWGVHQRFLDSLDEDIPGRLTVSTEASNRHMDLYFSEESGLSIITDPGLLGRLKYGISFVSESSDWVGEDVSAGWLPPEPARRLWDAPGGVFFIMQGKDTSSATVTNPGSYESYPTWMVDGYTPAARVGVAGDFVEVPFPVPAGKCLVIETDPRKLSATMYDVPAEFRALPIADRVVGVHLLAPVNRTRELGEVSFAPIPRGKDIPLSLSVSGTGLLQVKFPTLWKSAF